MSLRDFYDRVAPLLLGDASHADTVQALYGDAGRTSRDAARLRVYAEFCRIHRNEVLENNFVETRAFVLAQPGGEARWQALVDGYFRAHPMSHFELNQNGEHFPEYLRALSEADPHRVPPFLAELADLDWWEWVVLVAPDDPSEDPAEPEPDHEPDDGPLRIGATVEVRTYEHELLDWLDTPRESRPSSPELGRNQVFFWRDRDLDGRRGAASTLELLILKAVMEGLTLDEELAARIGVEGDELRETAADLHAAGILRGDARAFLSTPS